MHVQLETVDDFTGVMYTRGSFHKQSGPCFIKPKIGRAVRSLKMKFALDDCLTNQVGVVCAVVGFPGVGANVDSVMAER